MTRGQVRNNTKFPRIFPLHYRRFSVSKESEKLQPDFYIVWQYSIWYHFNKKIDSIKLEFLYEKYQITKENLYLHVCFVRQSPFIDSSQLFPRLLADVQWRRTTRKYSSTPRARQEIFVTVLPAAGIFLEIAWRKIVL